MQIIVAGGAGFIGSHLGAALLADGHTVIILDNFVTGNPRNIAPLADHPRFRLIEHDIVQPLPARPARRRRHLPSRQPGQPRRFQPHPAGNPADQQHRHLSPARTRPPHRRPPAVHLHLRSLRRPRSPSPGRNLLRQRQPGRPARLLRRGQTLRRSAGHDLRARVRRGWAAGAHLQHLRPAYEPAGRARAAQFHQPGAHRAARSPSMAMGSRPAPSAMSRIWWPGCGR